MSKKICKRLFSMMLVLVFVLSTFCFANASIIVTQKETTGRPGVTFYVPETIYLAPGATANTATNYRYYVDTKPNGVMSTDAAKTTGWLVFDADCAITSLTITCTNVSAGTQVFTNTIAHTSHYNQALDLSSQTGKVGDVLQWEATYTSSSGKTFNSYAYTYLYGPAVGQSGTLIRQCRGNDETDGASVHAFFFVTGYHSVTGGNCKSDFTNASGLTSNPLISYSSETTPSGRSIWNNSAYFPTMTNGGVYRISNVNTKDMVYPVGGEKTDQIATITVDKSRYTNYDQIPYLNVGYSQYYHYREGSGNFIYWISSMPADGTNHFNPSNNDAEHAYIRGMADDSVEYSTAPLGEHTRIVAKNVNTSDGGSSDPMLRGLYALSGSIPASNTFDTLYVKHKNGYSSMIGTASLYNVIGTTLQTIVVDKASLRAKYREACNLAIETDYNYGSKKTDLTASLRNAGVVLGNPETTAADISTALSDLTTKVAAMKNAQPYLEAIYAGLQTAFYVPETIYLNPADYKTGQYVYGVTTTGAVENANTGLGAHVMSTGANVYWSLPGASNITIAAELSANSFTSVDGMADFTVSDGIASMIIGGAERTTSACRTTGWSSGSGNTFNAKLTSLVLSDALDSSTFKFIKWTATFTYEGQDYSQNAYTIVYGPNRNVTGMGLTGFDFNSSEAFASGMIFIQGAAITNDATVVWHDITDENTNHRKNYQNISGDHILDPLVNGVTVNTWNDNPHDWGGGESVNAPFTNATRSFMTCYCVRADKKDGNGDWVMHNDTNRTPAEIVVDTSRFNNTNLLPNLKLRFMITDLSASHSGTDSRRNWYVADMTQDVTFDQSGVPSSPSPRGIDILRHSHWKTDTESRDIYASNYGTVLDYGGGGTDLGGDMGNSSQSERYNRAIDVSVSGTSTTTRFYTYGLTHNRSSSWAMSRGTVLLKVHAVDKGNYRTALQQEMNKARQSSCYTSASWTTYQNKMAQAAAALGYPGATSAETARIVDAASALVPNQAYVSARHINTLYHDVVLDYESADYIYGSDVAAGFNMYTGYMPQRYTEIEYDSNGANLFDFSAWANNSTSSASGTANMTVVSKDTTNGIVKLNTTTAGDNYTKWSSGGVNATYYQPAVSANTQYTFSFQYSGTATGQFFVFNEKPGRWSTATWDNHLEPTDDGTTYKHYSYTFTTDADTSKLDFRFGSRGSTGTGYFKDIRLVASGSGTYSGGSYPDVPSAKTDAAKSYEYVFYYMPNTYHAIFDPTSGGSFNGKVTFPSTCNVLYDDGLYVGRYVNGEDQDPVAPPTKTGCNFTGWLCSANGQVYAHGATDETTDIIYPWKWQQDVTFTAQWDVCTYTIAYELDGGTPGVNMPTTAAVDTTVTISNPTREGFTFAGWTSSSSAGLGATASTSETAYGSYSRWLGITPTTNQFFKNLRTTSGTVTLTATWIQQTHEHNYISVVTTEPTCTEEGVRTYTCTCGDSYTETIPALGHNYNAVVTAPTCTAAGFTTYTCSRCGDTYTDNFTEALGHDFDDTIAENVTIVPATTTAPGSKTVKCSRCDATQTEELPILPSADQPIVIVSDAEGYPGKTINVTVSLQNNPGIVATRLLLDYDPDVLTLTNVTNAGLFSGGSFTFSKELSDIPYIVLYEDSLSTVNHSENGVLIIMTFTVNENAPIGSTTISVTSDRSSTFDTDLQRVTFAAQNGTVQISERVSGDASGDGVLDLKDPVLIRRYLAGWPGIEIDPRCADVDGDGEVTLADVTLILRYLAGWDVDLI